MTNEKSKEVILTISMGFLILYFIFHLKWLILISFCIGFLGILSSWISRKIGLGWYLLAKGMSFVMNTIILSLIFYLVLFPIATIYKLVRRDSSMQKNPSGSTFTNVPAGFTKESFRKTW